MNIGRPLLTILAGLAALPAAGQTIVPVHEEPRHQVVHEGDGYRVLDIRIASGDTTLFHVHDAPIAYVSIDASRVDSRSLGGEWRGTGPTDTSPFSPGEVSWNLGYSRNPVTHRVTTVGTGPSRLIGIVNYGAGAADGAARPQAMVGVAEAESAWFRASRITLESGQVVDWASAARPVVAILIVAGRVEAERGDSTAVLSARGSILVQEPGSDYRLRNSGSSPASLLFVEVR